MLYQLYFDAEFDVVGWIFASSSCGDNGQQGRNTSEPLKSQQPGKTHTKQVPRV